MYVHTNIEKNYLNTMHFHKVVLPGTSDSDSLHDFKKLEKMYM